MRTRLALVVLLAVTGPQAPDADADDPAPAPPNLMADGSFEADVPGRWSAGSWRVPAREVVVVEGQAHEGRRSATLRIDGPGDDSRITRSVGVVPGRRYRASGWVKTSAVAPGEPGAAVGANLGLFDRPERSEAMMRDHDWTELAFEFESGAADVVTFAARLGFYSSTVTGQAWFDDLRIVDIGPGPPVEPRALTAAPAPPKPPDDLGPMPGLPPPPSVAPPSLSVFWWFLGQAIALPAALAVALLAWARSRGWTLRVPACGLFLAGLVPLALDAIFGKGIWMDSILLLLTSAVLAFAHLETSLRARWDKAAPDWADSADPRPRPGRSNLGLLIAGLLISVGSTLFVPMVIFGLLAMVGLVAGALIVGLALLILPANAKGPVAGPSKWGGVGLILLGSTAMPIVLLATAVALGGKGAEIGATPALASAAAWLVVVGVLSLGMRLRGTDEDLAHNAFFLMLGVLPLALALGSVVWPTLPKSL